MARRLTPADLRFGCGADPIGVAGASARKIVVFLIVVVLINVIAGSTMYLIEGPEHGYDSMFRGMYWSIVTMSTVGFNEPTAQHGNMRRC